MVDKHVAEALGKPHREKVPYTRREDDSEDNPPPPSDHQLLKQMISMMQEFGNDVRELNKRLTDHIDEGRKQDDESAEHPAPCPFLVRSIPNEDWDGHKNFHITQMQIMSDRAAFWKDIRTKVATWGIIGLAAWLVVIVWKAFLVGPVK